MTWYELVSVAQAISERIDVLRDEAQRLGVSSESIANAINTVVSGTTVTQIRDDNYLINVVMRGRLDERTSPASCARWNCRRHPGVRLPSPSWPRSASSRMRR